MILQLPFGTIYFTVFVTLIALSFSLMAAPVLQLVFKIPVLNFSGTPQFLANEMLPVFFVGGLILVTLTMHLAKFIGATHGAYAKKVLVSE